MILWRKNTSQLIESTTYEEVTEQNLVAAVYNDGYQISEKLCSAKY